MKNLPDIVNGVALASVIAKEGSFRAATRRTGIGFRSLKNQIDELERKLGFIIFHRTPDGVVATAEGHYILEEAHKIDAIISNIMRLGRSLNNETEGEVLLAATEGMGTFWISPQLQAFNRQHPKIAIRIHPSMALADMRRFEIDLALQVIEPSLPSIKRVKLGRLHLMLAAAPAYIRKFGEPRQITDLKDHTFVFHTSPQSSDRQLIERVVGGRLSQSQSIVMRNSTAHYLTIESGQGIGFIPSYTFGIGTKLMPLSVPLRYELDVWLCFHEDGRSTPRIAKVIDWLHSIFDPRLFPWFRREFVPPRDFGEITEANGAKSQIAGLSLIR
jgi:DNA-binding transcriptional LysR family regulator